jgi:hypothetical protein
MFVARVRIPNSQPFFGNAIKSPISAALAGTGNSCVFRHAVLRTGLPDVLAELGLRLRQRTKQADIRGRIRTFFGSDCRCELGAWSM